MIINMELSGKIVNLRTLDKADMPFLKQMFNDEYIESMQLGTNFPVTLQQQNDWYEHWDSRSELRYIIENKDGGRIGLIGLNEFNWINRTAVLFVKTVFDTEVRRKKDTEEAFELILKFAFDFLNMHLIEAVILEDNTLSRRLTGKCGFTEEARLRKRVFKRGSYLDIVIYSITAEEYYKIKKTNDNNGLE